MRGFPCVGLSSWIAADEPEAGGAAGGQRCAQQGRRRLPVRHSLPAAGLDLFVIRAPHSCLLLDFCVLPLS